jgi:hypothetical protein
LVVHGIGEQKKGDTIKIVVKHFYEFLVKSRLRAKPQVAATPEGAPGPVRATLDFHVQGQHHELEFTEIWWAHSFDPPPLGPTALFFIRWELREFRRLLGRFGNSCANFARNPRRGVSRAAALLRRADPVWLQMLLVNLVVAASAPLWLPLLLALWILDAGPISRFVPPGVREAYRMLVSIVTTRLADVSVYLDDAGRPRVSAQPAKRNWSGSSLPTSAAKWTGCSLSPTQWGQWLPSRGCCGRAHFWPLSLATNPSCDSSPLALP